MARQRLLCAKSRAQSHITLVFSTRTDSGEAEVLGVRKVWVLHSQGFCMWTGDASQIVDVWLAIKIIVVSGPLALGPSLIYYTC